MNKLVDGYMPPVLVRYAYNLRMTALNRRGSCLMTSPVRVRDDPVVPNGNRFADEIVGLAPNAASIVAGASGLRNQRFSPGDPGR